MQPDWPKIIEVARAAQSHFDEKPQIKSLGHELRYRLHDSHCQAWALGYRGSMDDWREFMRRRGGRRS